MSKNKGYFESYVHLSRHRIIFLNEPISKETATNLCALLLYYDNKDHKESIKLYINSPGGDAGALAQIYDTMSMIKAPIATVCMGMAASAAAVILAAGTKGQRYAFPHARMMIHGIQSGFPVPGDDMVDSKTMFKFLQMNNDQVMKMLSKSTGQALEDIKLDCARDVWLDADQAVKYGLIDEVL